jgi:DNA-binding transcriptional LysR family regulator
MMDADVELRHLRAFVSVARLCSFTQAAQELALSQPALSRTIQQLESALRVQLLERGSRHVEPTPVGKLFLEQAERVLGEMQRAIAAVREQVRIRLGFSWLLPDPWAQNAVARFERATGYQVNLVRCDDALAALQQNKVEVALVRTRIESPTVRTVHLFDEARVALCSHRCALANESKLSWTDVPTWPLVVNIVSGTTGPWSWPEGHGPTTIVETTNFDEWIESIAADRGIGVVSDIAVRRAVHPGVTSVPMVDAPPIPVSLAFPPGVQEALMRRFIEAALGALDD